MILNGNSNNTLYNTLSEIILQGNRHFDFQANIEKKKKYVKEKFRLNRQ